MNESEKTWEHEKGIVALENCLQECEFPYAGGTEIQCKLNEANAGIDLQQLKNGSKCLTEEQFIKLTDIFRCEHWLLKPFVDWLNCTDHWALVGLLEPTFSIHKHNNNEIINNVRAILDYESMCVIINNPDLQIEEEDSLLHQRPNGGIEELFIVNVEYNPYFYGRKPIYKLKVTRSKPNNMTKMVNIGTFNGDFTGTLIGDISHSNFGNDHSANAVNELYPEVFNQVHEIIDSINSVHRDELYALLSEIKDAIASGNKEKGRGLIEKLISIVDFGTKIKSLLEPLFV